MTLRIKFGDKKPTGASSLIQNDKVPCRADTAVNKQHCSSYKRCAHPATHGANYGFATLILSVIHSV
jgi:hypothetical protein